MDKISTNQQRITFIICLALGLLHVRHSIVLNRIDNVEMVGLSNRMQSRSLRVKYFELMNISEVGSVASSSISAILSWGMASIRQRQRHRQIV